MFLTFELSHMNILRLPLGYYTQSSVMEFKLISLQTFVYFYFSSGQFVVRCIKVVQKYQLNNYFNLNNYTLTKKQFKVLFNFDLKVFKKTQNSNKQTALNYLIKKVTFRRCEKIQFFFVVLNKIKSK